MFLPQQLKKCLNTSLPTEKTTWILNGWFGKEMHSRIVIVAQRCVSRHSLNISGNPAGSHHHHHASGSNGKHTCTTAHWRATKQTTHRSDLTQHGQDLGWEGMNFVGKHLGSFRTAISCHIQGLQKVETLFFKALKRCFGVFGRHTVIFQVENRNARGCHHYATYESLSFPLFFFPQSPSMVHGQFLLEFPFHLPGHLKGRHRTRCARWSWYRGLDEICKTLVISMLFHLI